MILKISKRPLAFFMTLLFTTTWLTTLPQATTDESENFENIAFGKSVSASSSYNDGVWDTSYLTDGFRMGSWPLPTGETLGWRTERFDGRDVDAWVNVNLEAVYNVNKVIIYPRGNGGICFPDDYQVQLSVDEEEWTTVANVTNDTLVAEQARIFNFTSAKAKFVRLHVTKLSSEQDGIEYACEFSEIEAYGNIDLGETRTNIALGNTVSSSSSYNDSAWNTSFLTDGFRMGSWPLPNGETLGWRTEGFSSRDVEVFTILDLGEMLNIDKIVIYPRGNGGICFPDDYLVQISTNGSEWTTVADVTGDTTVAEQARTFNFVSENARYVRIYITKLSSEQDGTEYACEFSEIEVYGNNENIILLKKPEIWLTTGETDQITGILRDDVAGANFSYEITGNNIIDLKSDGSFKASTLGKTTVKVTENVTGLTSICSIRVIEKPKENILITVPVWGNDLAITEQQFKWLREADVDGAMAVGHDMTQDRTLKMLKVARNIWDDDVKNNLNVFIHSYTQGITPDSTDLEVENYAKEYKNLPAFMGYHLDDERYYSNPYARLEKILKKNDPDAIADINFLPGMVYGSYDEFYNRLSDYAKIIGDNKSYLSFDNYPFGLVSGSVDESSLFGNYEAIRKAGLENDISTAFYVQGVGLTNGGYRRPEEATLRYHMASAMAYGFKWIKYFSWFVPGATGTGESDLFTEAIMDRNGNKTELYDIAAALNKQIHNVGSTLVKLDAAEVYHSGSKSNNSAYTKLTNNFFAQPVGDQNAILSLMKHKETGRQYLMIVNKDMLNEHTMSFNLTGVTSIREFDKDNEGKYLTADFIGGVLTKTFLPGEFALYELPEGVDFMIPEKVESNLLIGASSTASDTFSDSGWYINKAHDGIYFSEPNAMGWKVESDSQNDNWLLFDLGKQKSINRLDVYPAGIGSSSGNLFPAAFKLYVSNDNINWTMVLNENNISLPTKNVPIFRFEKTSARYVKFEVPSENGYVAIGELALYNDEGAVPIPGQTTYIEPSSKPDENLAANKSISSSSSYTDTVWNNNFLTDGIKLASWPLPFDGATLGWRSLDSDKRDVDLWIRLDLEAAYTINKVVLYPRGNGGICFPNDYEIQVSLNGSTWTTVSSITGDTTIAEQARIITFDDVKAKYVRVYVTKLSSELDNGKFACEISEIEVFNFQLENVAHENPQTGDYGLDAAIILACGVAVVYNVSKKHEAIIE